MSVRRQEVCDVACVAGPSPQKPGTGERAVDSEQDGLNNESGPGVVPTPMPTINALKGTLPASGGVSGSTRSVGTVGMWSIHAG